MRSILVGDVFDLSQVLSVYGMFQLFLTKRMQVTYGDLVGLIGSVLLHEPLGSRGRHVRDSRGTVGCFSRHGGGS